MYCVPIPAFYRGEDVQHTAIDGTYWIIWKLW